MKYIQSTFAGMNSKLVIFLCFCLFSFSFAFSQKQAIKLTNPNVSKEIVFKEGKRIRVKTAKGEKYSGKLNILQDEKILLDKDTIQLSEIVKIKRNPLLQNLIISGPLIFYGVAFTGASLAGAAYFAQAEFLFGLIPSAALIYVGVLMPNVLKGYKMDKGWSYTVIGED